MAINEDVSVIDSDKIETTSTPPECTIQNDGATSFKFNYTFRANVDQSVQ